MPIMSKQLVILLIFLHTTLTLSLSVSAQGYYTYSATAYPPALWTNNQTLDAILYSGNNIAYLCFRFICEQSQNCVLGVVSYYDYNYNYSSLQLVVWCANRDHPVKENATLNFVQDGNLILRDADGSFVWSTNTRGSSVVGMKLMDNGNLVLFDKNNVSIWESFDYRTDTWLPGQLTANSKSPPNFPILISDVFYFTFICDQSQNCVVGVVSYYSSLQQVVWCANRDHPVKENATLNFVQDGNLILQDADGSFVWSTNTRGSSVVGMKLMDNGNLVLFDKNNVSIWESFDYPTDTWLPGQALKVGQQLTASSSAASLGTGQFFLNITSAAMEAYINSTPPQLYFRYLLPIMRVTTNVTFSSGRLVPQPNFASIELSQSGSSSSPQFLRLESDGHLRYYELVDYKVNLLSDVFNLIGNLDRCAYPTVCGEYGICLDNNDCTCPDFTNFKPVDARQLNLGCLPLTPLSCQSTANHELLPLHDVTHFNVVLEEEDFDASIFHQNITVEQCKQACLGNCTCKAAFFKFGEDSSDGYCYLTSQLYSLMNNNPETTRYNSSAYIKVEISSRGSHRIRKEGVTIVGVVLGSLFIALLAISFTILLRKIYKIPDEENEDNFELMPGLPARFSFEELKVATGNFSRMLGQGGFGCVFEGTLNGERIAVKRLESIGQGIKEFLAEVRTIGSIHHINLVRLIGFCSEKSYRLLVYQYMCNGSLDKWIFYKNQVNYLDWKTRVQIITDIAKGLAYLHEECRQRIIHLDIKPQNILLDEQFHAKVSDFGLAKLIDREQSHVLTTMRGTRGYLAPEWLTSIITEKADVYSFGVVVLEIVCGRKNLDYSQPEECIHLVSMLQDMAKENRLMDIVDNCSSDMKSHEDEIMEMIKLAVWCLQNDSNRRPCMSVVLKVLEGSLHVEGNIDSNLTNLTPYVPENANCSSHSAPPSASLLSGGR